MNGVVTAPVAPCDVDRVILEELLESGESQLAIALRRLRDEACSIDPQAAVARFNSAF